MGNSDDGQDLKERMNAVSNSNSLLDDSKNGINHNDSESSFDT